MAYENGLLLGKLLNLAYKNSICQLFKWLLLPPDPKSDKVAQLLWIKFNLNLYS